MDNSQPAWHVDYDHRITRHSFFISHIQEDEGEVQELRKLLDAGLTGRFPNANPCFLDVDDWPKGRPSLAVIRERLLASQFMVAWITPKYLQNRRGWIWFEAAYAQLIESSFNRRQSDILNPFVVPLFHHVTVRQIERTPWLDFWSRSLFVPVQKLTVQQIASGLIEFYAREMDYRSKL